MLSVLSRPSRAPAPIARRAARVASIGLLTMMAAACGESSTGGGGSGGAPARGAGGVVATGGAGALGGNAATSGGGVAAGGGSSGGACHQNGEPCADSRDCCASATCNNTAGSLELNGCHPLCTQNADCSTGCCVLFTGSARGICGDAKWCSCGMTGVPCGSQLPACCSDQICLAGDPSRAAYACQKRCTTAADCPTKCCVPIPSLGASACLDPMYCPAMM